MWNFQDFTLIQILRQINFGESEAAFFALLGALNFANLVHFSIQKVQKFLKIKIQSL